MAKKTIKKNGSSQKSNSTLHPLGDRVVVRHLSEDEMGTKSPSGIIIPDTVNKEKPEQGIVISVGPGKYEEGKRIPMTVKAGNRVVFSKYGYDEVKIGVEEYYIVSEANILAIINE